MSGHIICFAKSVESAYFSHNGGHATMSGKEKVDFFESLGIILIIFEVKPSMQISAYESAVSSQSITKNVSILRNFRTY